MKKGNKKAGKTTRRHWYSEKSKIKPIFDTFGPPLYSLSTQPLKLEIRGVSALNTKNRNTTKTNKKPGVLRSSPGCNDI